MAVYVVSYIDHDGFELEAEFEELVHAEGAMDILIAEDINAELFIRLY